MQNLLLKSLVLTGVIGGSCFIVWLANENLQKTQSQTDPNQFAALEFSGDPEGDEDATSEILPEGSPTIDLMEQSEIASTIPSQSEDDEIQPTLAQNQQYVPLRRTVPENEEQLHKPGETEVIPDAFVAIPTPAPATSPAGSPEATPRPEVPVIAAAPVMPLTFYAAGGNDVPRVDLVLGAQNEERQSPGDQSDAPSPSVPSLPGQAEENLAVTEPPALRFGPSTKPNIEEFAPTLPDRNEQEQGMVRVKAPAVGVALLPASNLNAASTGAAQEQEGEFLPTPVVPILKNPEPERFAGHTSTASMTAPGVEENPFAKFSNSPAPTRPIVQVNAESEPSIEENPFARFQKNPVQTAAMEVVEPSELGFNSPPPQPSVPKVADDPFGTNETSIKVIPTGNTELAQNHPVPEDLLPPIQPKAPVFPSESAEVTPSTASPSTRTTAETSAESDLSVFPSTKPAMPVLAEPVPLPPADLSAVEEEVTPLSLPQEGAGPLTAHPFEPRTFTTNSEASPTNLVIPEPAIAPLEANVLTQDRSPTNSPTELEPTEVVPFIPNSEPAPSTITLQERETGPVENSMTISPRAIAEEFPSTNRTTVDEKSFPNPTEDPSETLNRTISSNPQSPELKIEKIAPQQASIGDPLIYSIRIHNIGGSDARSVVVEDRIPKGTRLEGTIPQAVLVNDKLTWELGLLPPGEQRTIQLKVIPLQAGDIGSVATVSFEAAVAAMIRVTAPELSVDIDAPAETLLGKNVPYKFTVRNTGQGAAKDVVLRAILPPSLKHPNGSDIEANLNDIPAGESRVVDLVVVADDVGVFTPKVFIWMNGKDVAENSADLRILESRIQVSRTGPERRFVGRPAQFLTQVRNDSSVVLTNLTIEEQLPVSLDLASPDAGWNPQKRIIQRLIPVLQPGESQQFSTQLVPKQAGELTGTVVVYDQAGNRADLKTPLSVKGFADLAVDIHRENNNVPVGDQVSFRLNLKNGGTATANNVHAEFEIPQGLVFAAATGPSAYHVVGNKVQFDPVDEIPVNSEKHYDIVLTAAEVCNTKVKIALHSAEYSEPINREEAVRVVSDAP